MIFRNENWLHREHILFILIEIKFLNHLNLHLTGEIINGVCRLL